MYYSITHKLIDKCYLLDFYPWWSLESWSIEYKKSCQRPQSVRSTLIARSDSYATQTCGPPISSSCLALLQPSLCLWLSQYGDDVSHPTTPTTPGPSMSLSHTLTGKQHYVPLYPFTITIFALIVLMMSFYKNYFENMNYYNNNNRQFKVIFFVFNLKVKVNLNLK